MADPCPSVFAAFAAQWFPVLIDAVCGGAGDPAAAGIHYFLVDLCITFLGWSGLFPQPPDNAAAKALLDVLVS